MSQALRYDVVVVGAGINGMVAALRLAQKKYKVLLLEKQNRVGGLARSVSFFENESGVFKVPGMHISETDVFDEGLAQDLQILLPRQEKSEARVIASSGKEPLHFLDDVEVSKQFEGSFGGEAVALKEWRCFLDRVRPLAHRILSEPPPALLPKNLADALFLLHRGVALRRLGSDDMLELLRLLPSNMRDVAGDRFIHPLLGAVFAARASMGSYTGPFSAGTVGTLLLDDFGVPKGQRAIKGGVVRLVKTLEEALSRAGVEVRCDVEVDQILVADAPSSYDVPEHAARVRGVRTVGGKEFAAAKVVSCADVKHTLLNLVGPLYLPFHLAEEVRVFRCRGTTSVLALALKDGWALKEAQESKSIQHLEILPENLFEVERAFDDVKYQEFSKRPVLRMRFHREDTAPKGHHTALVHIGFTPFELKGGWTDSQKSLLVERSLNLFNDVTTGIQDHIVGHRLWTPPELEQDFSVSGGHLRHGEPALDQLLMMRPGQSCSRYSTSIHGLFLGGNGNHPGIPLSGRAGFLSAGAACK
ncbi:MAG: NAD(P)/FAD-dependent oxidoreductase [Deltaproteobacteria bacterium]|nr:NAD(P)/FAD-dependent oxidoreductase [Deltaproteobacteria bacterium]